MVSFKYNFWNIGKIDCHSKYKYLFGFIEIQAAGGNGAGSTPDKLNSPWGVYVDVNGSIYVVDRGNHRVQLWISGINCIIILLNFFFEK